MSRFNPNTNSPDTINLAGGEAFSQTSEMQLISLLLTSFASEQFYRSSTETFSQIKVLLERCNPLFAAKAAIYARTQFGMRSITHVLAAELAKFAQKQTWSKSFFEKIIYRPDDMTEILSYYLTNVSQKIPNALKKGFALAFNKFDKYSLAKYRMNNHKVKLIDIVNLVHPKPTEKNAEALNLLVQGKLTSFDTWESELTKAGQTAESEEEKDDLKKEVWVKLISEKKIGYFALLRNLRNIISQAPEMIDAACEILVDEKLIKKSLVLPFRFSTAYEEMKKVSDKETTKVILALNKAIDLSLANVPKFNGKTLVVLDVSGSMMGKPSQIGSLFASILIKTNNADFITFDDEARYTVINPADSTLTIAQSIRFAAGGTNFHAIFKTASSAYDRIIILSDMQGWIGYYSPKTDYDEYRKKYKCSPFIYSFDLQGLGSMQFPESNVFCLTGFSDKIFDIMNLLESDKNALKNEIEKINL